jgi:hypothetical protein
VLYRSDASSTPMPRPGDFYKLNVKYRAAALAAGALLVILLSTALEDGLPKKFLETVGTALLTAGLMIC